MRDDEPRPVWMSLPITHCSGVGETKSLNASGYGPQKKNQKQHTKDRWCALCSSSARCFCCARSSARQASPGRRRPEASAAFSGVKRSLVVRSRSRRSLVAPEAIARDHLRSSH